MITCSLKIQQGCLITMSEDLKLFLELLEEKINKNMMRGMGYMITKWEIEAELNKIKKNE